MQNLAGDKDCDRVIEQELRIARVPVIEAPPHRSEVPYSKMGLLQNLNCPTVTSHFEFCREWYYWVVSGPVPLSVAIDIYKDPACVKDVRAGGDCGCSSPEEHKSAFDITIGKEVMSDETWKKVCEFGLPSDKYIKESEMLAAGRSAHFFVMGYHIDTEIGLRVFVDYLRNAKVVPCL